MCYTFKFDGIDVCNYLGRYLTLHYVLIYIDKYLDPGPSKHLIQLQQSVKSFAV